MKLQNLKLERKLEGAQIGAQGQYWTGSSEYRFVPVLEFADSFDKYAIGRARTDNLAVPFNKEAAATGSIDPLIYTRYALNSEILAMFCHEHTCALHACIAPVLSVTVSTPESCCPSRL